MDPSVLYEKAFLSAIPRLRGYIALCLFRAVYRDFAIGRNLRCWGKPMITMSRGSSITIGDDVWLVSDRRRAGIALYSGCKFRTFAQARIVIGDGVGLNGTSITSRLSVEIGSGTMAAANVVIVDSDFHQLWPAEGRFFGGGTEADRPVAIGRNVWIGMGSIILKGVTIGDNSVIGAGSVVTRSVPANVIAAGNPAIVIRDL